jgi:trigger factor
MTESTLEAAKTERPNKVQITDAGPCRKKISIEIPAETVSEQLGTSLDTLMLEAEIPGFRKGRVPRRLVERKFGSVLREEAKKQLIAQAYSRVIDEHRLRVIGEPVGADVERVQVEDGRPLAFEVEVEVPPRFDLPPLDGIAVKRPIFEVSDAMVTEQIDRLRLQEGRLEPREAPEPGDYLTGHGRVIGPDGTVHIDIVDAVVQVPTPDKNGQGMILGIKVADFGPQLGLPRPGETAVIRCRGPEGHEIEAVRGADLRIEFAVSRVDRIIPASEDEIVARFGFADLAQMREMVRSRIEERVAIDQSAAMRDQVARYLVSTVEMELPERMTHAQTERILARTRYDLMHRGLNPQQVEEHLADLRSASGDAAVRELKLYFILDQAAEALGVRVSEAEINARISQMALAANERPEKLRAELVARGQVPSIFQQIREHKTLDAILAKATVTDVSAEEFKAERDAAARKPAPAEAASATASKDQAGEPGTEKKPARKPARKADKSK